MRRGRLTSAGELEDFCMLSLPELQYRVSIAPLA
jgi:hypothetical protein